MEYSSVTRTTHAPVASQTWKLNLPSGIVATRSAFTFQSRVHLGKFGLQLCTGLVRSRGAFNSECQAIGSMRSLRDWVPGGPRLLVPQEGLISDRNMTQRELAEISGLRGGRIPAAAKPQLKP